MKNIETLNATTEDRLVIKSSNTQYKGTLTVKKGGAYLPISFDMVDYIDCDGIKTHKVFLAGEDNIGYHYKINKCKFVNIEYLLHDKKFHGLKQLPKEFGEGFYEEFLESKTFTNADNGAMGMVNSGILRVGTDYVLAKETLEATE